MINDRALRDAAHRSFVDAWCRDSKIVVNDNDGLLYYSTSLNRYAGHSGIFRTETSISATNVTDAATDYTNRFQNRATVWCRPGVDDDLIAAAREAGFVLDGTHLVMARDAPIPRAIAGIMSVNDEETLGRFRDVMVGAWDSVIAEDDLRSFFTPERIIEREDVTAFMVNTNGHDVAGAVLVMEDDIGDIFWVGCLPEWRSRGYGSLVTVAATNAAFTLDAQATVLQTTGELAPFYKNLGYERIYAYEIWLTPAP